jgi:hypothetical protein
MAKEPHSKLSTRAWLLKLVGTVTTLVLASAQPSFAAGAGIKASPASGFHCRHVTSLGSGQTVGSQVDGDMVTICLTAIKVKRSPVPVTPDPSRNPKPGAKPKTSPNPKPSASPSPTKPPGVRFYISKKTGYGVFKPRVEPQTVRPSVGEVGQNFSIHTLQLVRRGSGYLVGRRVQVRFAPVQLNWNFGDSSTVVVEKSKATVSHAYARRGRFVIVLRVRFTVQYRIWGAKQWITEPDTVLLASNPLVVWVGLRPQNNGRVVLLNPDSNR